VAKLLGARGIRSAFETCGITIALFCLSWQLAVALLVSAPLLTPVVARLSAAIGAASKASQAAAAEVSAAADEVVENMRVVKLFAQQQRELSRFHGLLDTAHQLALKVGACGWQAALCRDGRLGGFKRAPAALASSWAGPPVTPPAHVCPAGCRPQVLRLQALLDGSSRVRNTLCVLATLSLGSWMALHSAVSLGTLYSFFVFSFSFAFALGNLTTTVGDMAKAAGAISRAMGTMQQALGTSSPQEAAAVLSSADDAPGTPPRLGGGSAEQLQRQLPQGWQAGIEFRDVSFSHPGWKGWTIDGLSFHIPARKTVALVGPR
jgi:ABC-type multidrug transport system fused ATPase/permease subunit